MNLTERILELLAAAPDQPEVTIAIQPGDLPPGFVLPTWALLELVATGRAIVEAVADRPTVRDVILRFPGNAMPVHFPITPRN